MAITPATKPKPAKKINLNTLTGQLDREWEDLQSGLVPQADAPLLTYYHSGTRTALTWIEGDPYTYLFPAAYQGERLARLCGYLKSLEEKPMPELHAARDKQVELLREQTWPAYVEVCVDMTHEGTGGTPAELTYTWAGVDSLWTEEGPAGPVDAPAPRLPKFHSAESEAFHCNALAVLFLNRATRRPLCDLDVTPF
ncbi:hypothetical protein [Deinococcus navajonensis]|uniref:Uncharacterized protein n=1 Tax=Deinococcus navajonensis TaxID=309884 RepID=A0ABV8XGF5_9DEIO